MKTLCTIIFTVLVALTGYTQPLGWNHSQVIAVTENSGTNLYDYQLRMHFDSQSLIAAGEMNSDCSDLRFGNLCDAANLNYWIESGINSDSTVVWVKLDSILANDTRNIFLFYGNPLATSNSLATGTFFGPHSATDSVASGGAGGVADSQRGFRFTPNTDLLVTSFGKREPNGTTRFVTLFDFVTQAIIAQTQVSGPAAQYSYSNLASPIWLIGGTQYVLELFQGAGDGYYFGTSSQIGQHITYGDMRYCNSCTENTFPTNTLTNYHYGYPDLWYYTRNVVTPAPTFTLGGSFSVNIGPDSSYCGSTILDAGNAGSSYVWSNAASSQSINIDTSGFYFVTVTNPQNCVASDSINIVINAIPTVDLGADTSFCTSGNVIAAGNGFEFIWSNLDTTQTITVAASGTYSVLVSSIENCFNSDTIDVNILGLPTVTFDLPIDTVCTNYAIFGLSNGTPAGGVYSGTGVSAGNFDPSIGVGNFLLTYTYTDLNGCTNNEMDSIRVIGCAGLENENDLDISIYPNPNSGSFYIECSNIDETSILRIYDIIGKNIYSKPMFGNIHQVNLITEPGTYIIEIATSKSVVRKRVIIK